MRTKRKIRSGILTLIMAMTVSMAVPAAAEAAGPKKLQKVTLKIGGMDMTKQTYSVSKGKTAAIKAVGKPASAKKAVSYKSSNTKVVANTTFVWRIKRRFLWNITRSYQTIKPSPPKIMSAATGRRTAGLLAKVVRLENSPIKPNWSKPALQKEETAIKIE